MIEDGVVECLKLEITPFIFNRHVFGTSPINKSTFGRKSSASQGEVAETSQGRATAKIRPRPHISRNLHRRKCLANRGDIVNVRHGLSNHIGERPLGFAEVPKPADCNNK